MSLSLDRADFIRRFKSELDERILAVITGVVSLEKTPDDRDIIDRVFREAHTLKGTTRMLELNDAHAIAHHLEDIFDAVRAGRLRIDEKLTDVLLSGTDALALCIEIAAETSKDEPPDVAAHCDRLAAVARSASASDTPRATGTERTDAPRLDTSAHHVSADVPSALASGHVQDAHDLSPPVTKRAEAASGTPFVAGVAQSEAEARSPGPAGSGLAAGSETLRVDVETLDRLVRLSREFTTELNESVHLLERLKELELQARDANQLLEDGNSRGAQGPLGHDGAEGLLGSAVRQLAQAAAHLFRDLERHTKRRRFRVKELSGLTTAARMVAMRVLLGDLPRVVRDLAGGFGRQVDLILEGEDTVLDKRAIDELRGPFLHLIRNAIAHGIEDPETRESNGKPAAGQVTVRAFHEGDFAVLEVEDDGAGLNREKLLAAAIKRGVVDTTSAKLLTEEDVLQLVFVPGLTTSAMVTSLSGRGVGMDVVRATVEELDGRISLSSRLGEGTCVRIVLPLVLSIARVLVVESGAHLFALPTANVDRVVHVDPQDVLVTSGARALRVGKAILPLVELSRVLGLQTAIVPSGGIVAAVVLEHLGQRTAVLVDALVREENVVVHPLGAFFAHVAGLGGATMLGNGDVAVILQASHLTQRARSEAGRVVILPPERSQRAGRILVVDDSLNARELMRAILEAAGHKVDVAVDGADGLQKANAHPFDMVITDLEMPRMNGLELTRALRASANYAQKPVVVVTTRDDPEDRLAGLQAGASAYIGKNSFNQASFQNTIRGLIE